MSFAGWPYKEIAPLRGAWSRSEERRSPKPERAFEARNVTFDPFGPVTRPGHRAFFAALAKVTSMYNWITRADGISQTINRLFYFENEDTLKMRNLITPSTDTLFTLAGRAHTQAEAGDRSYCSVFKNDNTAAGQARIVYPLIGGTPSDKAFAGPMDIEPVVTDQGAGQVTAGLHHFGYIMESRSGYLGRPNTNRITFTVAAGGRVLQMQVLGDMPADAAWLHPIMTRVENPNQWYFVPDAQVGVPGGAVGWDARMTIDISDNDLTEAVDANPHFNYLSQSSSGTGPFDVSVVVEISNRMGYVAAGNKLYISDPEDFEVLTEDQHVKYLPGQKEMITSFVLRGVLYIFGPHWTYAYRIGSDVPVTWEAPDTVSETLGVPSPYCLAPRTSGDYAWVANPHGLYPFDGRFPDVPISYMNAREWGMINWAAPYAIQVKDDVNGQRVRVAAPLITDPQNPPTEPTHILTFDYEHGIAPDKVDFSLDDFDGRTFSSIEAIVDPDSKLGVTVVGPSSAADVEIEDFTRRGDDNGRAVETFYKTGYLIGSNGKFKDHRLGGVLYTSSGSGALTVAMLRKDGDPTRGDTKSPVQLAATRQDTLRQTDLTSDDFQVSFQVKGIGSWFSLNYVKAYHKGWTTN